MDSIIDNVRKLKEKVKNQSGAVDLLGKGWEVSLRRLGVLEKAEKEASEKWKKADAVNKDVEATAQRIAENFISTSHARNDELGARVNRLERVVDRLEIKESTVRPPADSAVRSRT